MAVFTPDSIVYLCNVPFSSDGKHALLFGDSTAQASYFSGLAVKTYAAVDYQKKDNAILVPDHVDDLAICNYAMYRNSNFTNKWFYAFIEKMEWRSNGSTAVFIKTDVFQTWFLSCSLKPCFVEREHVADDTIGLHILDENLELGDLIQNSAKTLAGLGTMDIIVATTKSDEGVNFGGILINNVFTGCGFYGSDGSSLTSLKAFLKAKLDASAEASIASIYMCPHIFSNFDSAFALYSDSQFEDKITINAPAVPSSLDGYTPKNNKLLTFPYSLLYVHNNSGMAAAFPYEHFSGTPQFEVIGSVLPGAIFKIFPVNLLIGGGEATDDDADKGITISGYPLCSWNNDSYKAWLAANTPGMIGGIAGGALAIAGGISTGNALMAAGGIAAIFSQLERQRQASLQPPQAQGTINAGPANCCNETHDFYLFAKSIKYDRAAIIDEFFTMFGYKVQRVKIPETNSRPVFNYVKTVDCSMTGAVPQDDLTELKALFDRGITLWHSAANIYDYTADNAPIEV